MAQDNKSLNWKRVLCAVFYAVIPLLLIYLFHSKMFYLIEEESSWNFYRLLWCICCTSFGFANVAWYWRKNANNPFPEYITYYPPLLLLISCLIFSILHLWKNSSSYVFYYLSFALCFNLGFMIDSYWDIVKSFFEKVKSKI